MLDNIKGYDIILVSHSPRRQELLTRLGLEYKIGESLVEETYPEGLSRCEIPVWLSRQKAQNCSPAPTERSLVIAADTIVWIDGQVLGKPASPEDAKRMLCLLSGKRHYVVTGVTIQSCNEERIFAVETAVTFAQLTSKEVDYYINTYRPFDKAGAYGIQEWIGMVGVRAIEGSFYNVMGLPVARLYEELKTFKPCC